MRRVLVAVCLLVGCSSDRTATTTAPKVEPTAPVSAPSPTPPAVVPALAPRDLPGFRIELPKGTLAREELTYPEGVVALHYTHGEVSSTMVMWIVGSTSRQDLTESMAMFGKEFGGASPPVVEASTVAPWMLSGTMTAVDGLKVRTSVTQCSTRVIQVMTASPDGTTNDALHTAIVTSFACTPDQAGEDAIPRGVVRYAMTLPGWKSIRKDVDSVMLVSDPGSIILIDDQTHTMAVADVLASPQHLLTNVKPGATKNGRTAFTASAGDQPVSGWIQMIECTTQPARIFVFAVAPTKQGLDAIMQLAKSGHCLSVKAAAPVWPDASK